MKAEQVSRDHIYLTTLGVPHEQTFKMQELLNPEAFDLLTHMQYPQSTTISYAYNFTSFADNLDDMSYNFFSTDNHS